MRFAIEGRVDNVGVADIFLFLSQTQRTSVVSFERPDQETRVFFVEGQPVMSLSSRVQLQLETRLAAGGVFKMRDIESALERQKASASRVPQTLISELMATEASMEKDLRAVSLEALRDLATWTNGVFTVYDGVVPPPWAYTITADFPALLIDALRGQCQKEALQKEFVSRKAVLRLRAQTRSSAGLSDSEKAIMTLVNGERTLEELVKKSGLDEQKALGAMHVLCALHLTDLLPPQRMGKPGTDKVVVVAPAPTPARGASPADKGGSTDKFQPPPQEANKAPIAASEVTPRIPAPAIKTGESTARLPVLSEASLPQANPRLLRISSEDKTEDVPLTAATFAIGRHPRNDLVLKDPRISSFHCRVELEGKKYVLLDLKSRNGTLLNSARIDKALLKHNDQIQLGSTKISYIEG